MLRMLAGGMTPAEIAFALDLPKERVELHIAEVIDKLEASDSNTAAAVAIEAGLIPTEL